MDKVYQVFVSSTFSDLEDERRQVSQTLAKAGYISSGMELFPATDMQQPEFIKRIIDRCDYYVVIVGGKYGSLAEDGVSFRVTSRDVTPAEATVQPRPRLPRPPAGRWRRVETCPVGAAPVERQVGR
jgi:hypothetical protein